MEDKRYNANPSRFISVRIEGDRSVYPNIKAIPYCKENGERVG